MKSVLLWGLIVAVIIGNFSIGHAPRAYAEDETDPLAQLAHPYLFFSADDVANMKARMADEPFKSRWEAFLQNAGSVLDDPNGAGSRDSLGIIGLTAFAYAVTGEERYGDRAVAEAKYIAGLPKEVWAPPLAYTNGATLETAEYALATSLAYDWCYNLLTPDDRTTLLAALNDKAFAAYAKAVGPVESFWVNYPESNWMGVIHGGIGLAALAVYDDSASARKIANYAAAESTKFVEQNMGEDGNGTEGLMYLRYGQEFATMMAMATQRFYGTDSTLLSGLNAKLAGYSDVYLEGSDGRYANFNDMSESTMQGLYSQGSGPEGGPDSMLSSLYETLVPGGDSLLSWAADNGGTSYYYKGIDPFYFLWRQPAGETPGDAGESDPGSGSDGDSSSDDTTTLTPVADAFTYAATDYANTNYGVGGSADAKSLVVKNDPNGNTRESYLKFDLSGLTDSVASAKLRLYLTDIESSPLSISVAGVVYDDWTEGGITWNNRPAASETALDTKSVSTTSKYYEFDVTPFVAAQTDGIVSLQLKAASLYFRAYFSSKEGANAPQLMIKTGEPPVTPPPSGPTTLNAIADVDAYAGAPDQNYGGDPVFDVRTNPNDSAGDDESYVKFDTSGITEPVTSAKLRLFGSSQTATAVDVSVLGVVYDDWTENGLTWNNRPAASTPALSTKTVKDEQYYDFDVTSFVNAQTDGILSLQLKALPYDRARFQSKENEHGPQLIISTGETPPPPPPATVLPSPLTASDLDLQHAVLFRDAGYGVLSSDSLWFAYNAGDRPGNGHRQFDNGTFILVANGERLVQDPGYGDTATDRHSTVTVNGFGQKEFNTTGDVLRFGEGDGFQYIASDNTSVYDPASKLTRFVRHAVTVRGKYVVLLDDLQASQPASFASRIQSRKQVSVAESGTAGTIEGTNTTLQVVPVSSVPLTTSAGSFVSEDGQGTVNNLVLSPSAATDSAVIATVLYPTATDGAAPVVTYDDGTITVAGDGQTDTIVFNQGDGGQWQLDSVNGKSAAGIPDGSDRSIDASRFRDTTLGNAPVLSDAPAWLFDPINEGKGIAAPSDQPTFLSDFERPEAKSTVGIRGTPVIDGSVDDVWNRAVAQTQFVESGEKLFGVPSSITPVVKTLWDDDNFYVLAEVKDSLIGGSDNADLLAQTGLEVYLDQGNDKSVAFDSDDLTVYVGFDGKLTQYTKGDQNMLDTDHGIESSSAITDDGYIVEVKIPWTASGLSAGDTIGYDVALDERQAEAPYDYRTWVTWNDETNNDWQSAAVFGNLELLAPKLTTAVKGAPVIDGTVDDIWDEAVSETEFVESGEQFMHEFSTIDPVIRTLWDDDNLYVLAEVKDSLVGAHKEDAALLANEALEVYVDQGNEKGNGLDANDLIAAAAFNGDLIRYTKENVDQLGTDHGVVSRSQVLDDGYVIEMKIPWTLAGAAAGGHVVGFDVSLSEYKAVGDHYDRKTWIGWNDETSNAWQSSHGLGNLLLEAGQDTPDTPNPPSTPSTPSVPAQPTGDPAVIQPVPVLNPATGAAQAAVTAQQLSDALKQAQPGADGALRVAVKLPAVADAKSYALELPASALAAGDAKKYEIATPLATIELSNDFLSAAELNGAESFEFSVAVADPAGLSDDLRRQIGDKPIVELNVKVGGSAIAWNHPDSPVTVAIDYAPTAEELAHPDQIVVWYIDSAGAAHAVPNGKYDAASGKVIFQTTHFSQYAVAFVPVSFGDLGKHAWAQQAVEALAARAIVTGRAPDLFDPAAAVTRGEFAALLARALELRGQQNGNFADAKPEAYYYDALGALKALGIATGTGDNRFNPGQTITRQDLMVLASKALQAAGLPASGDLSKLASFRDAAQVADYAKTSVADLIGKGIVHGDGARLHPQGTATRAEAAVIIYNLLKQ